VDDARFVSQDIPATLDPGQAFVARLVLENTGTTTWSALETIRLGAQSPDDNTTWSAARVALDEGVAIDPGEVWTVDAALQAPATPGTFPMQWRMVRDPGQWFGEQTTSLDVEVTDPGAGSATISGPAVAMARDAGANAPEGFNTIVDPTFTITLSSPNDVAHASLQVAAFSTPEVDPASWVEQATWTNPASAELTQALPFATAGSWAVRVVLTDDDGLVSESPHHPIDAVSFAIDATVDNALPIVGQTVTLTAAMSPGAPAGLQNTPEGWFARRLDDGLVPQGTANPMRWTSSDTATHDWLWVEVFPDGSRLHSNVVRVSPQSAPPTEVQVQGGGCIDVQQGLNQAAGAGLPLRLTGAFTVDCRLRIPSNVTVNATGATFSFTKSGRIRNATNGSGGGYTHAGGFVWDGGTFVGAGNGVFTISHSPGFTIRNATLYAWADATDDGHAIEINSSGGPHTPDVYSIEITGNTFLGVTGQRANSNDEAVQYDFSWDGSGGDAPFDDTMTHNLHIANNTFHRLDESGAWEFSLCAIGGHRGSAGEPAERHNGFLIENNSIHGAVGATVDVSPNKGAIALWNARDVRVRNNAFFGCTSSRLVSGWDANDARNLNDTAMNLGFSGNTHNGSAVTITMPASNTTGG